jgi:hypothetical protein
VRRGALQIEARPALLIIELLRIELRREVASANRIGWRTGGANAYERQRSAELMAEILSDGERLRRALRSIEWYDDGERLVVGALISS